MKKIGLLLSVLFLASFMNLKAGHVSFNYFYSTLSPHGEWISLDYDLIVWRPTSVNYNWTPYSIGRWAWTDDGWYWDSYEPFGWATYHYGRWHYDDYYGWVWIPDYEWAPAWVEWRYNDSYLGWAPLPPYASFRAGVGISFSINRHLHHRFWNFVSYNNFCHNNVSIYIVNNSNNYRIFNKTKYRTNYYADRGRIINKGIDREYVERRAGRKINRSEISRVGDYNSYRNNVKSRGEKITAFRPDAKEAARFRDISKYNVKKSDGKTSLIKDKISVRNRTEKNYKSDAGSGYSSKSKVKRNVETKGNNKSVDIRRNKRNSETNGEYSKEKRNYTPKSSSRSKQIERKKGVRSSVPKINRQKSSVKSSAGRNQSKTSKSRGNSKRK